MAATAMGAAAEVPVDIDPCVPADAARVRAIVALELKVLAPPPAGEDAVEARRVRVDCAAASVNVTLFDGPRVTAARTLDLTGYPPAGRARLLALQISEMLSGLGPGRAPEVVAPEPAPPPPAAAPTELRATVAPTPGLPSQRFELAAVGVFERAGRPADFGGGAGLLFGWRPLRLMLLHADGQATWTTYQSSSGAVVTRSLSVALTPAVVFASAAQRVVAAAGVGVRGGWASLRGRPGAAAGTVGQDHAGLWWAPHAAASVSTRLVGPVTLMVRAEAGVVARAVVGTVKEQDADVAAVQGLRLNVAAGLGWRF